MSINGIGDFDIVGVRYSVLKRARTNRQLPKRDLCSDSSHRMRVKLVRKFANVLNGIDLSRFRVGEVIDVAPHDAAILVAEGWAEAAPPEVRDGRASLIPDE